MKKIILLLFILTLTKLSFSQVEKYRSIRFSMIDFTKENSVWSEWLDDFTLITFDLEKERFVIYNDEKEIYDVVRLEKETKDKGMTTMEYLCVDEQGLECYINLIIKDSESEFEIEVIYANVGMTYRCNLVE
jgi:hypothetical protein